MSGPLWSSPTSCSRLWGMDPQQGRHRRCGPWVTPRFIASWQRSSLTLSWCSVLSCGTNYLGGIKHCRQCKTGRYNSSGGCMATRSRAASGIPPVLGSQAGRGTRSLRGSCKALVMTWPSITICVDPGSSLDGMGACLQQAMVDTSRSPTEVTLQLAVADHATCLSLPM